MPATECFYVKVKIKKQFIEFETFLKKVLEKKFKKIMMPKNISIIIFNIYIYIYNEIYSYHNILYKNHYSYFEDIKLFAIGAFFFFSFIFEFNFFRTKDSLNK